MILMSLKAHKRNWPSRTRVQWPESTAGWITWRSFWMNSNSAKAIRRNDYELGHHPFAHFVSPKRSPKLLSISLYQENGFSFFIENKLREISVLTRTKKTSPSKFAIRPELDDNGIAQPETKVENGRCRTDSRNRLIYSQVAIYKCLIWQTYVIWHCVALGGSSILFSITKNRFFTGCS